MKITRISKPAFLAVVVSALMFSCQTQDIGPVPAYLSEADIEGMIKLGKKLENPYSVETMRTALDNIKNDNINGRIDETDFEVYTTHLYVKLSPKNEEELDILKNDSTLVLYDYPMDVEIEEGGNFYHDPSLPIDQPTYQYMAIPVDTDLPVGIDHEILAELFIPDENRDDEESGRILSESTTDALVDEALRITGNLEESDNARVQSNKWRPAGRIQVWDGTVGGNVPLIGAEVRAKRWFTTYKGKTKSDGRYSCDGKFKKKANYSIKWERYHFLIRDKWLSPATDNGPKKKGDWNRNYRGGVQEYYATIFRAAHHYYYLDIRGLRRPPKNGFLKTQMKIRALNENKDILGSHKEERRFLGLGNQIRIYNPNILNERIYATTIHELAHASHWNMSLLGAIFDESKPIVKESWARGVQWELTRMEYSGYIPPYIRLRYTGIVQDMIDGTKTTNSFFYWWKTSNDPPYIQSFKAYSDQVNGYSIRQIEDALIGQKTWDKWKNNIKNKYNNGTENKLGAAFTYWNTK